MSLPLSAVIYLVTCHTGPADHFLAFSEVLKEEYEVHILAGGAGLKKLQERKVEKIESFSLENKEKAAAIEVAKKCAKAAVVITDVGDSFQYHLHEALKTHAPKAFRFSYYDNPELFVPGEYFEHATKVMGIAEGVLFANAHHAEEHLPNLKRGIGYYPLHQAERIALRRQSEQKALRTDLFKKLGLEEKGQTILMYAGGNSSVYFDRAFPAFLCFLTELAEVEDLSPFVFVLQQHPAAKGPNRDGRLIEQMKEGPNVYLSPFNSEDAQVVADTMIYYQTSMAPQFVLAGIPTIQASHEVYEDLLVTNYLCPVATHSRALWQILSNPQTKKIDEQRVCEALGVKKDWPARLKGAIEEVLKEERIK
ncbi:MAG: hypothetical protein KGJ02_07625 [Verrucomicrobiota bacterium]|nr:hypothetical protein [Verrucomicrobiota bacterium]